MPIVVLALKFELFKRMARIGVAILLGIVCVAFIGCQSATQTIFIEEMQPGGRANVGASGSSSIIGPGGVVTTLPGSTRADFGAVLSDAERYRVATEVGFSPSDAIIAVAISIAENGTGDPSRMSTRNQNGTYDLGLWQINSGTDNWARFGGQHALEDPLTNARAARTIYLSQGWCAWYVYEPSCDPYHTGSYRANLDRAREASIPQPWHDLPAFNQYDRSNWGNPTNFAIWSPAACSAAALRWMLTAYGHPLPSIDEAVSLIGPFTGITPAQGLSDHTGPGLVAALGKAGFRGWNARITNDAELRQRIALGPLMMGGDAWFGVGHWFVGMGSDNGGIYIRESSGNNVTYLTWARLHGEVGWSGWVVGIQNATASPNQA